MLKNDHIEFANDRLTDKGPCSGLILCVGARFTKAKISDGEEWFSNSDLKNARRATHHKTHRPLYIVE